jgi:hypothetical protein
MWGEVSMCDTRPHINNSSGSILCTTLLTPHVLHCYSFNSIVLLLTDSLLTAAVTASGQGQGQGYITTNRQSVCLGV